MTAEQRAAFVNAQAALLNAEIAGMVAENMIRESLGQSMAYDETAFVNVRNQYINVLGHDACIGLFRD